MVKQLCVLLRLAESLDRSRGEAISHARLRAEGAGGARLELRSSKDCHLEVWSVESHVKAFEEVFGRRLKVAIRRTRRG